MRASVLIRIALLIFSLCGSAEASQVLRVLFIGSDENSAHKSVIDDTIILLEQTTPKIQTSRMSPDIFSTPGKSDEEYDLLIVFGQQAAETLRTKKIRKPVFYALIPAIEYTANKNAYSCLNTQCAVLLLDQPAHRQFALIKAALPQSKSILLFYANSNISLPVTYKTAAKQQGLTLNSVQIASSASFIQQIQAPLAENDVLLVINDPQIMNRNTARPLLLSSYKHGVPMFAYSQALIDAGAAIGITTTPAQFARQISENIEEFNHAKALPPVQEPKYYTVITNPSVLNSLGISTLPPSALAEKIDGVP